jgi:Tol biopolymer transport system component
MGRTIVFVTIDSQTKFDLWLLPLTGERKPTPFLRTPVNETSGRISPDGRWIAYTSDESGRYEVYVTAFPVPQRKWRISTNGGPSRLATPCLRLSQSS